MKRQTGMTLVEVTVASMVFAMIMLAVVTAMRTFGQSYDRLQETTARTSVKREVDRFLRQALKDALGEEGYFEGTSREVVWVAPLDRVGSAGGLQHLRLQARGDQLVLSFAPFDREAEPDATPAWGSVVKAVPLINGLESFRVSYRAQPEDSWGRVSGQKDDDQAGLPWGIQLQIETEAVVWPPLTVAFEQYEQRL
jgi:general secretion pathway protein J